MVDFSQPPRLTLVKAGCRPWVLTRMLTDFRKALGCFATGVTVVTTRDAEGAPVGLAVNSFASVSMDPPLVSFCIAHDARSWAAFRRSAHFAVNIIDARQLPLVQRFASRRDDKFDGVAIECWASGAPILQGAYANLECERYAIHEAGDHWIVLGRVKQLKYDHNCEPLVFSRGQFGLFQSFPEP